MPIFVVNGKRSIYQKLVWAKRFLTKAWPRMTMERQNLLDESQMPLPHGDLLQTGALVAIKTMEAGQIPQQGLKRPCIVFTSDPLCLDKGSAAWFLQHWGSTERCRCILTGKTLIGKTLLSSVVTKGYVKIRSNSVHRYRGICEWLWSGFH